MERDELLHFAFEMLVLFQVWPLVACKLRRLLTREAVTLLLIAALVLLSTWAFRLPAVPRLYLPVLALSLPALAPLLARLVELRSGRRLLAACVAANLLLGLAGVVWIALRAS